MLKSLTSKTYFLLAFIAVSSVQFYAAFNHQLFVDEAFYWLEGQWLAWSYSEVPGWTPWTLAVMDWLLPHHHFNIRTPNLLAAMSIPWLGIYITRALTEEVTKSWLSGLLLLALPILGVAGTLAIPDIWLVFFALLAMLSLIQAIKSNQSKYFMFLGLVLALGINVHLRFWLLVLITCGVVFWQFKSHRNIIFQLLKYTLPLMLLGFVPIVLFNMQHDFPLLAFQLKERHPWEFQTTHFSFFLAQIVITTPWVFYLCLKNLKPTVKLRAGYLNQHTLIKTIVLAATIHWLVYAILGFFSDTLRLNVHWPLISYVLLLIVTASNHKISPRLKQWAVVTGLTANLWLLFTLSYWFLENTPPPSDINTRITKHAKGWVQLAAHTDELLIRENKTKLLTDHFMTLAQLKFYSKVVENIAALPHPLNTKHGRAKQLQIMGMLQGDNAKSNILVVEHSSLKLIEIINFYQSICDQLNGIELIDSLDVENGLKRYHYFKTAPNNEACDIPPIVYYEIDNNGRNQELSGWILGDKNQPMYASLYDARKQTNLGNYIDLITKPLGSNPIFKSLNPEQYQLYGFKLDLNLAEPNSAIQLKIELPEHIIYSQRLYLNH